MKKLLIFIIPLLLVACGGADNYGSKDVEFKTISLCADSVAIDLRASLMKSAIDSALIARLDTFMIRNNRYAHLSSAIEDEILLPLSNDTAKVNYCDTLVALLDEYNKVEQLSIADSCLVIAKNLAKKNN